MLIHQPESDLYGLFYLSTGAVEWGTPGSVARVASHIDRIPLEKVLCVEGRPARFSWVTGLCRVKTLKSVNGDISGVYLKVKPLTLTDLNIMLAMQNTYDTRINAECTVNGP